jgi:hypothetical protein
MSFHHQPKIVTNGLVLYLDAANTKSYRYPQDASTWYDLSTQKYNGSLLAAAFEYTNLGNFAFNGSTNSYVQLPFYLTKASIEANGMAWGMWINTSTNVYSTFLNMTTNGEGSYERCGGMGINFNTGKVYYILYNGAAYVRPTSVKTVNDSVWHNVMGVYTVDQNMQIFVDGILEDSDYTGSAGNPANYYVNISVARGDNWLNNFSGKINGVTIYNRQLSSAEILQNYNAVKSRYGL